MITGLAYAAPIATEARHHQAEADERGGRPVLEVREVVSLQRSRELVAGCNLDAPEPGLRSRNGTLGIAGWVVARDSRASEIEVLADGEVIGRAPVNVARPDVGRRFELSPGSYSAGFRTALTAEGEGASELHLRAVVEGAPPIPLWTIRIEASRLPLGPPLSGREQSRGDTDG